MLKPGHAGRKLNGKGGHAPCMTEWIHIREAPQTRGSCVPAPPPPSSQTHPCPQLLFQIITLTILWHMPAQQLPVTVHCSAAYIMSFIGFCVGINVCKSLELNLQFCLRISALYLHRIFTRLIKLHKERLIWARESKMFFFFFTSCKSLLELRAADLWSGRPSWWLQRNQILSLSIQAGIRNCVPSPSGLLRSVFSEKDVCFYTPGFDHQGSLAALASRISI